MTGAIATRETVEKAVQALSDAGQSVTADAVIRHLGGGSKSTVTVLLRELLPQLGKVKSDIDHVPPPVRLALNRLATGLWSAAEEEAKLGFLEIQKRYESFLAGQSEDLAVVTSERDRLLERAAEQDASLATINANLLNTEQLLRKAEEELRASEFRNRTLENEVRDLQGRQERIDATQDAERRQLLEFMASFEARFPASSSGAKNETT